MMFLFYFYLLIIEALYILVFPALFLFMWNKPFRERLLINSPIKRYDVLVHAASVGEINGIKKLLTDICNKNPELSILLTTNTLTGRNAAFSIHDRVDVVLSPLDIYHLRLKQLSIIKPNLILITETEIWPAFLWAARNLNIPIVFLNARISPRTLNFYIKVKSILKVITGSVKVLCAQTEVDRNMLKQIFRQPCIVAGNLKFCADLPNYDKAAIRNEWGYKPDELILVMGSSRPGEEKLILHCFNDLKIKYDNLRLIIVPRHLERMNDIRKLLKENEVSFTSNNEKTKTIHVIDAMGLLNKAYAISQISIIGGSFYPFGGHNPLEAAYYGRIIVMGPFFSSCAGSVKALSERQGIILSDKDKLRKDLENILEDYCNYQSYGEKAKEVINMNSLAVANHLKEIDPYLSSHE